MNLYISNFNYKTYFLILFFSVSIILITCMFLIERFSLSTIKNSRNSSYNKLIKNGEKFEFALLGTSHTSYGNAIKNDNFLYFGESGTFFPIMYIKVKRLLEYAPNLKTVILEMDDLQFSKKASIRYEKKFDILKDDFVENKNYSYLKLNDLYSLKKDVNPIIHKKLLENFFEVDLHRLEKLEGKNLIFVNNKFYKNKNWLDISENDRIEQSKKRLNNYNLNHSYQIPEKLLSDLQKTINLLQKNEINIIFIRHPQSNEYFRYMDEKLKSDINKYINTISSYYNIKIFDYRYIFSNNQNLFSNQDHLNPMGWKIFVEILIKDLEKITKDKK